MTKKLTNRQAIGVLDGLWSNPLFGEAHRQAFEIGIKAIKALEQQSCEGCISRQAAIIALDDRMLSLDNVDMQIAMGFAKGIIYDLPPVTPQPKTGHWIFVDKAHEHAHCSECDYENVDLVGGRPHNYCPNCGAKMIEPQAESEE